MIHSQPEGQPIAGHRTLASMHLKDPSKSTYPQDADIVATALNDPAQHR